MRRNRSRAVADPYAGMTDEQLAKLARKNGVKGVPERMKRETIIEKLEAL